jgi:elongation factor Ts
VGIATGDGVGAIVEVNSETDFVARNEAFQKLVGDIAALALEGDGTLEGLLAADYPGTGRNVADELTHQIATIGENMTLRRVAKLEAPAGVVASYMHNQVAPDLGKIGVLVAIEAEDKAKAEELGKQVAMHIAATKPESLSTADLDPELVERERQVLSEQARESGKPEDIIAKMVEGRLRKFYEEVVLLEQTFVIDGENKVGKVVEEAGVGLSAFVRFGLGEGIEKEEEDFAAEVKAQLGS